MVSKKHKKLSPGLRARQYLLDHPLATTEEVSNAMLVGSRTVSYARSFLIRKGIVPPTYFDRSVEARSIPVEERASTDQNSQLNQYLATLNTETSPSISEEVGKVLTSQQNGKLTTAESLDMLAEFARIARKEGNFPLAKDAIVAYNKIEQGTTEAQLGPPPPQTDTQKVTRITHLLDVVGPTVAAHGICQAFVTIEDRRSFEEEFARQSVTHPPTKEDRTLNSTGEPSNDETNKGTESEEVDPRHAENPPHNQADIPLSKAVPGMGGGASDEEGLRNHPGLEPNLGSPGEVGSTS